MRFPKHSYYIIKMGQALYFSKKTYKKAEDFFEQFVMNLKTSENKTFKKPGFIFSMNLTIVF